MSESELSHRGLMKMANAKLDYLIQLLKYEGFVRQNGESPEAFRFLSAAEDNYKHRAHEVYKEDKQLN